jgi:exodeoxyribonuclease-5
MAITCTLGAKAQRILYATVYKKMTSLQPGEVFDIMEYMQDVFDKFTEKQGKDVAVQFVQQIPYFAGVLDMGLEDVEIKLPEGLSIKDLSKSFRNVDTGIETILNMLGGEITPQDMLEISDSIAKAAQQVTITDTSDSEDEDVRLKARDVNSGTSEQFKEQNPNEKGPEEVDTNKNVIYNTLNKIRSVITSDANAFDTIEYQGKRLKLKTIVLNRLPEAQQTNYTRSIIAQYNAMAAKGTDLDNVTPPSQQLALVITDEKGAFVYFDLEGNVSDKDNGNLVYQLVRDVRKDGSRYRVTDIYGIEDQILNPTDEALARINEMEMTVAEFEAATGKSFEQFVKEVDKEQQTSFKNLYDFKNKVLTEDKSASLPINGISGGVKNKNTSQRVTLQNLDEVFPDITDNDYRSIETLSTPFNGIQAGASIITIGELYYKVDRPWMSDALADKIASVLTNPNISDKVKYDYVSQFLQNNVAQSVRRHRITYEKGKLKFFYKPYTFNEAETSEAKKKENAKELQIPLAQAGAAEKIAGVLKKGYTNKKGDQTKATIVIFSDPNIKSGLYFDIVDDKIVVKDYIEFLKSLDAEVFTKAQSKSNRYNPYLKFRLPSEFTAEVEKAEENLESVNIPEILKEDLVGRLSEGETIVGTIQKRSPQSETAWRFTEPDGNTVVFFNHAKQSGNIVPGEPESISFSDVKAEARLVLNPNKVITKKDGSTSVQDVVEVYVGDKYIGNVQETAFYDSDLATAPAVDSSEIPNSEEDEIIGVFEPSLTVEEKDDAYLNPVNVAQPTDDESFEDFWGDLSRSTELPNDVTPEQLKEAEKWWNESEITNVTELGYMANLVNSNVYAKFIAAGSELLLDAEPLGKGKLARIFVNKAKGGNFVDVYHEAWHVFSQLYLTREQKRKLYAEYRSLNPEYANLSSLEIEELIAEDFRAYALKPKVQKSQPVRNTLFRKILNFLKKLFGKISSQDIVHTTLGETSLHEQLFEKLYFAKKNKKLLNDYTPLIANARWNTLDRGVTQVSNRKEDALSKDDSQKITRVIDSIFSKIIDQSFKTYQGTDKSTKGGVLRILSDPDKKLKAYDIAKGRIEKKIKEFKAQLALKLPEDYSFDNIKTLKELEDNAVAVIKSSKGDNKYVYLKSQIDNYDKINLDSKKGTRLKGELYKNAIDIISDFYSHKSINDSTGKEKASIIVVDSIEEAQKQFDNYQKGGATSFTSISFDFLKVSDFETLDAERRRLADKIRVLQTAVINFGDKDSGVIKYHIENSVFDIIRKKYVELEDQEELVLDDPAKKQDFDKKVGDKSLLEFADKEVTYILKSLFKIENGKTVLDEFGFEELATFRTTWNNVVRTIAGVKDPQEQYRKLVAASNIYPELKQLVEYKLPNPAVENSPTEYLVTTSFWQTFKKPNLPYIQLTVFRNPDGTLTSEVTNAAIDVKRTTLDFISKFKSEIKSPYINRVENITFLNLDAIVKKYQDTKIGTLNSKDYYNFLKSIGFYLDDLKIIKDILADPKDLKYYGVPYLFEIVKEMSLLEANPKRTKLMNETLSNFKQNPLRVLTNGIPAAVLSSKQFKDGTVQRTAVERIVGLQNKYGSDASNFSLKNPEGNSVFTAMEDNELSYIEYGLNNAKKLSDLWTKHDLKYMSFMNPDVNPMTKRLQIVNSLYNLKSADQVRRDSRSIRLNMVAGTQLLTTNKEFEEGVNTTNLDMNGKYLQEFNTVLKAGMQELMRPGSKSSSFGLTLTGGIVHPLGKTKNDPHLYIDIDMFMNPNAADNYAFENIILPYIAGETERINKYKTTPEAKNYIGYNNTVEYKTVNGKKVATKTSGDSFNYFDDVLTEETKNEILNLVTDPTQDLVQVLDDHSDLKQKMREEVGSYFERLTDGMYDLLQESKYIDPALMERMAPISNVSDKERALVKAFVYNYWIQNFEVANLFVGDIAQFNHLKEELHKRISGAVSGGPGFRSDLAAIAHIKEINKKSYAALLGAEYNKFSYDGTLNTAVIKDVIRESYYLPEIEKGLKADYEKRYAEIPEAKRKALIEKRLKKELKPYKEMNEADGAGYITLDAYRALKKLQKNWSNDQENLYQKVIKGVEISASDVVEFFPVYKLQHYGFLANTKLPVIAMHKFALMPLIPSAFKGSDLENLHKQMLKSNIQYVTYQSGSKVGIVTSNGDQVDEVYSDPKMKTIKDDIKFTENKIYVQYLKEATSVNSTYKGKSTNATQLRKLVLEGQFLRGIPVNDNTKGAVARYYTAVNSLTKVLKLELLQEVGAVKKNGKYEVDLNSFLKYIRIALGSKKVPQHLLDDIGVTPDNRLKTDLSIHLEARLIEKTILTIFEKKFIKQKVKGEPLVQVPGTMTNGLWDNQLRFNKLTNKQRDFVNDFLGSNTIPFYRAGDGKTIGMGVALTLQGDFLKLLKAKHIDGQEIGTRERLNEMIVDDAWLKDNEKAITLTGVRIPVQGYNSIEFARVHYFLDPSAGNIIIPPAEIVAKSGSDFDVDKITAFMPNLSSDGKFIEVTDSYDEIVNKLEKGLDGQSKLSFIREKKKEYENELLDSIKSILEMPDNYANLVRPNETYILKDIADELEDDVLDYDRYENIQSKGYKYQNPSDSEKKRRISPTRTLEPMYNLQRHAFNLEGKDVLGIAANDNSFHPVLTAAGAEMPATYKSTIFDDKKRKLVEQNVDLLMRLLLNHNTVKNAKGETVISLSDIDTKDLENKIADLYSQAMNGTVDVEKDPWIFLIQANVQVAPVLFYLFKAGVPIEEAVYFVSQPLVREYAKRQKIIGGAYAAITNQAPPETSMIRWRAAKDVLIKNAVFNIEKKVTNLDGTGFKTDVLKTVSERFNDITLKKEIITEEFNTADFIDLLKSNKYDASKLLYVTDAEDNPVFIVPSPSNEKKNTEETPFYDNAVRLSNVEGVLTNGKFDKDEMRKLIKDYKENPSAAGSDLSYAMFMHFIEIEQQLKGLANLKRKMKVDTKTYKNPEEILRNAFAFSEAADSSKVQAGLGAKVLSDSVLSEFFDKEILQALLEPIFPLAHNKVVTDFILDTLDKKQNDISRAFPGVDSISNYISAFKDGLNNFIYQNFLSNVMDSKGNITTIPDVYRERVVKINNTQKQDVVYGTEIAADGTKTKVIYINKDLIEADYNEGRYLSDSTSKDSYANRGLRPFSGSKNPFASSKSDPNSSKSQFYKFVLEREYTKIVNPYETLVKNKNKDLAKMKSLLVGGLNVGVRDDSKTREAYEAYINQRALLNSFNRNVLMYLPDMSYSDMLENIISEFPELKSEYPVLEQLRLLETKDGERLVTLNDMRLLDDVTADIYEQNIKRLGNVNISKVENTEDNKRISEIFSLLPLVAVYQHGYGPSAYGINMVIPTDNINRIMQKATSDFMENYLNNKSLNLVFDSLVNNKSKKYKNYVVTIDQYNNADATVEVEEAPSVPEKEMEDDISYAETSNAAKVETNGIFTFADGTEIDIPFNLNADQTNALYELEKFYNKYADNTDTGNKTITLRGYAGTGKTTIMSLFDKYLKKKFVEPVYSAPTNRANAVTKLNNPKARVLTLHKLFGLRPDLQLEDGDYSLDDVQFIGDDEARKIKRKDVLIIDESSMINDALYKMLLRAQEQLNIAIIYMGDPQQIRPVNQEHISKVFTESDNIELKIVERTGDNPILKESTDIRNGSDFSYISDSKNGKGVEYLDNVNDARSAIAQKLKEQADLNNPLHFRMLLGVGNNGPIAKANDMARSVLYDVDRTTLLVKGELLMGYSNFDINYQTQEPLIINSGDYIISALQKRTKSIPDTDIKIEGYDVTILNALNPDQFPANIFIADHNKSTQELIAFADHISSLIKQSLTKKKIGDFKGYGRLYAQAKNLEKEVAVMVSVTDKNGKVKIKKTLDYGYAHTIHKSQGGTYNSVMIFDDSITNTMFDSQLKRQLKYVAMSRATDNVYVLTNKSIAKASEQAVPAVVPSAAPVAQTNNITDISQFVTFSGAAKGSDKTWAAKGKKAGVGEHVDFVPSQLERLTPDQAKEVENAYQKAFKQLGRKELPFDWSDVNKEGNYSGGLVRRDYLQAKAADAVFAISTFIAPGAKDKKGYTNRTDAWQVEGGTGYAVQMAINLGKPVFMYDQLRKLWYRNLDGTWERIGNTPFLRQNSAVIGTQQINNDGIKAIDDVYRVTLNALAEKRKSLGITTTQPSTQIGQEGFGSDVREPVHKEGTMSFSYNNLQRPDVLSKTTFDAIVTGERIATTRFPEDTGSSYWFDTMPGDTITFWSGKSTNQGKAIDVKVISVNPVDFTKMTDEELENWSKLEGWSLDYARNKKGLPKRNKGIQIVFEKIEKGGEGNVITDTNTDNLDNSDEMDNTCSTPFLD